MSIPVVGWRRREDQSGIELIGGKKLRRRDGRSNDQNDRRQECGKIEHKTVSHVRFSKRERFDFASNIFTVDMRDHWLIPDIETIAAAGNVNKTLGPRLPPSQKASEGSCTSPPKLQSSVGGSRG